jgi:hypothetical protein
MPSRPKHFVRRGTVNLNLVNHSSIALVLTCPRHVRLDAPHVLTERDEPFDYRGLMETSACEKSKLIGSKSHRLERFE